MLKKCHSLVESLIVQMNWVFFTNKSFFLSQISKCSEKIHFFRIIYSCEALFFNSPLNSVQVQQLTVLGSTPPNLNRASAAHADLYLMLDTGSDKHVASISKILCS